MKLKHNIIFLQVKTTEHHQIDKISCLVVSHETVQLDGNETENSCDWDPKTVLGRKSFVPDQKITQVCLMLF